MNRKLKKKLILNVPYAVLGLFATNLGEAWRMATGSNASEKLQSLILDGCFKEAFSNILPSIHPLDLCVGAAVAGTLRLAVYLKGKNVSEERAAAGSHSNAFYSGKFYSSEDPYLSDG